MTIERRICQNAERCERPNLCDAWDACLLEQPLYRYDETTGSVVYFEPPPRPNEART